MDESDDRDPETGLPIGARIEPRGDAPRPGRITHRGRTGALEPLDPERHGAALAAVTLGPGATVAHQYLGEAAPTTRGEHDAWVARAAASTDPLFFAVVGPASEALGRLAFMRIEPAHRVIEIGHILFGPTLARTTLATEALWLAMRHALGELGYRRLEWKCNAANAASRAAALRLGFRFEGVFRQHMIVRGRNRDTAWYAITDGDWPVVRAAFAAWLSPSNFDADGRQRARLEDLRATL